MRGRGPLRDRLLLPAVIGLCAGPLLAFQGKKAEPEDPARRVKVLRERIRGLEAEKGRLAARIDEMIRLRVAMDITLPVEETLLLAGTKPAEMGDPEAWRKAFEQESLRTRELRDRLADLYRGRMQHSRAVAAPPALPSGIVPVEPGPLPVLPEPAVPKRKAEPPLPPGLVKAARAEPPPLPGPVVPEPFALDPLTGAKVLAKWNPVPDSMKRVATLIRTGREKFALSLLAVLLEKDAGNAGLLFLKGTALERDGRVEEALRVYAEAEEADTVTNAEGKKLPGPWASAAAMAAAAIAWEKTLKGMILPDGKGLRW